MQRHKYTEEEKETIKKLYEEGHGSPYIAKQLNMKTSNIAGYISRHIGLRSCSEAARKYQCDEHFFDNINTEEKAYWLGFMYADGYVTSIKYSKCVGLSISEKDRSHLEKFRNALKSTHPIHEYATGSSSYKPGTKYVRLLIAGNNLYEGAVSQGIVEHKTNIITPPDIPASLHRHFIRGYFDGDGCLAETNTASRHEFAVKILGTELLLDYIKDFILTNGIAYKKRYYKRRADQTVSCLELSGHQKVKKFLDLLYNDAHVFLERKHERYLKLCNLINSRVIPEGIA